MKLSNLKVPKGYTLQKIGITQSLINTYLKCRVKFLLALNRFFIPSTSPSLHFGIMGHEMLDQYYRTGKYNIKKFRDPELRIDQQEIERQKTVMTPLLNEYCSIYKNDEFINTENIFTVRIQKYKLHFKIDGITPDFKYLVDHKFRGRIDEEDIMDQLSFDFQSLFYIIGLEHYFKKTIRGAFNNVIRNPGHKITKQDKNIKAFQDRLQKEIQKNPEHFFKRFKTPFTKPEKQAFQDELINGILPEIEMFLKGELPLYKNRSNCKVGYAVCPFLKVCSSGHTEGCKQHKYLFPELEI